MGSADCPSHWQVRRAPSAIRSRYAVHLGEPVHPGDGGLETISWSGATLPIQPQEVIR